MFTRVFVALVLFCGAAGLPLQAAAPSCVGAPSGLVSWWTGDSNENDMVGGNNPYTISGVSLVPGEVLNGFSFGSKGYIQVPSAPALANQSFTWAAWVRPDGPGPTNDMYGSVILAQNINDSANAVSLEWSSMNNKFNFQFGPTSSAIIFSKDTFLPGQFYFVSATYDQNVFQLFVNGVPEGSFTKSQTIGYTSSGWLFGSNVPNAAAGYARTWNGVIDEIQAYNRALSIGEIQSLYNSSTAGVCRSNAILPQFVFGGGWYSALYFTNNGASPVSFTVAFTGDDGRPLSVPALGGSSATVNLAAYGTARLEAPNVGSLVEGYASATLPAGITGYGIFRQSVSGVPDQEAVVPLSVPAPHASLVFDDTNFTTGIAVANLSSAASTITVLARDNQGNTLGTAAIPLAANAKTALALKTIPGLAGVGGTLGSVDFTASSGSLAVLGLRFSGTAFTSIPTAAE